MILVNVYLLVVSVNSKKVPPSQIKQPLLCQYKDFFYNYFLCDKFGKPLTINDILNRNKCNRFQQVNSTTPTLFLFYDVNSVEGFNLRRDVYIRMAVFIKSLRRRKNFEKSYLVLPPFYQLYHWNLASPNRYRSNDIDQNDIMFWNHFFDLNSMKRYTAVLDIWEYFEIMRNCFGLKTGTFIDHVFRLRHFESMFLSGKFEEKFDVQTNCERDSNRSRGQFINLYTNFSIRQTHCAEFQGSAGLLYNLIQKYPKR